MRKALFSMSYLILIMRSLSLITEHQSIATSEKVAHGLYTVSRC